MLFLCVGKWHFLMMVLASAVSHNPPTLFTIVVSLFLPKPEPYIAATSSSSSSSSDPSLLLLLRSRALDPSLLLFLLRSLTPPPLIPSPRSLPPPPPPSIPHSSSSSSSARGSPHLKLFPSYMRNRWELPIVIPAPSRFPSGKHHGAASHSATTRRTILFPGAATLWCSSPATHLSLLAATSPTVAAIEMLYITFPKYDGSTYGTTRCCQFTTIRNLVVASDWRCFRARITDHHSRAHSDWKDEISSSTVAATVAVIAFFGS